MRTEDFRKEIRRLVRERPFLPFFISLENGERIFIEHPENIAFSPRPNSATDFYAISGDLRVHSSFDTVTSVSTLQNGSAAKSNGHSEDA
jgi:hypothetical protein